MKYRVIVVLILFFTFLVSNDLKNTTQPINTNNSLFTKEEMNYLTNKKVIKICIMEDSHPMEFFANEKQQGVIGEIFTIFQSNLPLKIKLIPVNNSKKAQNNLLNGNCDIKSIVIQESNPYKYIYTTKPYLDDQLVLITKNDKPYISKLNENFRTQKFIVRHEAYKIFLQKHFPFLKNIEVNSNQKQIVELLENEEIYGYIDLAMISNHFIEHFSLDSVKVNTKIEETISISIGITEREKELIPIFNKLIDTLSKEYVQNLKNSASVFYRPKVTDYTMVWQIVGLFFIFFTLALAVIIKQNRLKTKIKQQKETFEKLYLKSSDCVILAEQDIFIDCNEATLKKLGYKDKNELFGLNPSVISPLYQPDGRNSSEKAKELIETAILNGSHQFEWVHKKSTGEEFWVDVVLTTIKLENKNIIHALWRDIDERKKFEYQSKLLADQSQKAALGRLMSLIAHQWRQPLSIINGITSQSYHNLSKPNPKIDKIKTNLLQIENITEDLSNAIQRIHDFYVYDEEKNENRTKIKDIINECLELLYPSFANTLEPHVVINEIDEIKLLGSTYGIHQIILTLLTNCEEVFALRNIPHPHITIDLYKENNFSYIVVKDNGGGIEKDILDKIFEPYVSTKGGVNKMRGLGLNIAKDIVENHLKGSIEVKSLDGGAIFTIRYKEYDNQ